MSKSTCESHQVCRYLDNMYTKKCKESVRYVGIQDAFFVHLGFVGNKSKILLHICGMYESIEVVYAFYPSHCRVVVAVGNMCIMICTGRILACV